MKAKFIEPMLLLRTSKLSEGDQWTYEIKWDGYALSRSRRAWRFIFGPETTMTSHFDTLASPKRFLACRMTP